MRDAAPTDQDELTWRELVARGIYHTGLLKMAQRLSRAYELTHGSGRLWPKWQRVWQPKFLILGYHRVGTEGVPLFSRLSPEEFEAQLCFLKQHYRIVSLDELWRELQDPQTSHQAAAITFDDGYRDVYTCAFPILQKYRIPATVFLTVDSIETGDVPWYDRVFLVLRVFPGSELVLDLDRPRFFDLSSVAARLHAAEKIVACLRTLPDWRRQECCAALEQQVALPEEELRERILTWEQIRAMHRAGITFGSHTLTHRVISRLEPAQMQRELLESKKIIECRLDSPVMDFSYPFGKAADCGTAAREWVIRSGYRLALTTVSGINKPSADPYALRRISMGHCRSLESFALFITLLFLRAETEDAGRDAHLSAPAAGETGLATGQHELPRNHA